ncbi:MAG TPA: hypothetical protein VFV99_21750 [Kofleriaceae bacterium]|nr:hypothetical protein [Kofleriaceae bacterium]
MTRASAIQLVLAAVLMHAASAARADPLRLRADALGGTQSPAGLIVLEADGKASATTNAEAIVWAANDSADVLVIALRARTADGRIGGKVGRFVASLGALRPVQIDGASGRMRLPHSFDVEAIGGVPVPPAPSFGHSISERAWDWVAGGRIARRFGDYGSVGIAMLEQRDDARLATREVGVDAGIALTKRHDVATRVAYDLANPGLADAYASLIRRGGGVRAEVYAGYRAASHLLPATSLFTVLGDTPSSRGGMQISGKLAPRLELGSDMGLRGAADELGVLLVLRARLALDDKFASAITGELRRDGVGEDAWTGARGAARIALSHSLTASTELELVVPDRDRMRGAVWPWALAALAYQRGPWQAAAAIEASASAQYAHRVDVLVSMMRMWGQP